MGGAGKECLAGQKSARFETEYCVGNASWSCVETPGAGAAGWDGDGDFAAQQLWFGPLAAMFFRRCIFSTGATLSAATPCVITNTTLNKMAKTVFMLSPSMPPAELRQSLIGFRSSIFGWRVCAGVGFVRRADFFHELGGGLCRSPFCNLCNRVGLPGLCIRGRPACPFRRACRRRRDRWSACRG